MTCAAHPPARPGDQPGEGVPRVLAVDRPGRRPVDPGALGVVALVTGLLGSGLLVAGCAEADPAPAPRTVAQALPDELPRVQAFVARERGLAWQRQVPVEALEGEAFEAAHGDDDEGETPGEEEPAGLDDPADGRVETYAALGLTPSASGYRKAWEDEGATVRGFYDAQAERVVLRGDTWTPTVEEVLVHELTHALDDQHVDLGTSLRAGAGAEEVTAGTAVVEGDAEDVAWAWYDALDDDGRAAYERAWGSDGAAPAAGGGAADPLLTALALFPYDYGHVAVGVVAQAEGPDGVSDLLRAPLTTTEQVLAARPDPGASPGLAPAVEVEPPPAPEGAEVLGTGSLGLFPLSLLPLAEGAADSGYRLDPADVVTYAWAGDAWRTWVDPDDDARACTAVLVRLEDVQGRDDLAEGLSGWVAEAQEVGAGLEPVGETDLRLTGCAQR